ncbi:MAG: EscU/YscU/HrcU family type III secretion system export apparatus switch protein [Rhizomicrobium sp.]
MSPVKAPTGGAASGSTIAVALHYKKQGAPRVVAKGRGEVGRRIIDLAKEHGVPLEENPALAEALSTIDLGEEIPPVLYHAVAVVLRYILKTSGNLRT